MINHPEINKMVYGGDYNPEQWPLELMSEDMRLMELAHMDIVTLNVFNWVMLQPDENSYDFSRLDAEIEILVKHNKKICLATATAVHPAWMAKRYPEVLRVEFDGKQRKFGGRHNSCPNSLVYRHYAGKLAEMLARRYKDVSQIVAWHISNEFGGRCYCEKCEKAFRVWLGKRYHTIEALNKAWYTSFWGHTFLDWDEIVAPSLLTEHFADNRTMFQSISLDYARFMSDSLLACYKEEYKKIKQITPHIQITTNLMGFYKELDYFRWAEYMDFVAWDNYPANEDPYARIAMSHDLMRGLKAGMPFILMEQTPSVTNWLPYNALKRPGVMRLWSYQAVAHGADGVMFFQLRRSIGACEKYHGALIDHAGHENTRVFRECSTLGAELEKLGGQTLGTRTPAKVAMIFDWENWWAIEYSAGPTVELKYIDEFFNYYRALLAQNISVDIISPTAVFEPYDLIIAPVWYMVTETEGKRITDYVEQGGHFITTFFSGVVNENDLVHSGGYPGVLKQVLGIWVEEVDALPPGSENVMSWQGKSYPATLLCEIIHCNEAIALSTFERDFYAGGPAITENQYGKGKAWYIGTRLDEAFYDQFITSITNEIGINRVMETPIGVEVTRRQSENNQYTFILNHNEHTEEIIIDDCYSELLSDQTYHKGDILVINRKDVKILKKTV